MNLGKNIKSECNGKGDKFRRPTLILKKLSGETFIGIPLSSKNKKGSWFKKYNFQGKNGTALLYQIRIFHKNRLGNKLGELDETDFYEIKKNLAKLLNL